MHPDAQRDWKRTELARALGRPEDEVEAVVHSEYDYDYRALAKFVVGPKGMLGSYRRGTHTVTNMDGCVVHAPAIAAAHPWVQTYLSENRLPELRYVVMRASLADERVIITLISKNARAGLFRQAAHDIGRAPFVAAVDFHHNDSEGNAIFASAPTQRLYDDGKELCETIGGLRLQLKSHAFSQINPATAALLYAHVVTLLSESTEFWDLYAGSGGISLSYLLQNRAGRVVAVENIAAANQAARESAELHGLQDRLQVIDADVLSHLQACTQGARAIVVNPPRKGLGAQVAHELLRLAPAKLVYVSCNPKSLARDLRALQAGGYRTSRITPFDLFPNTVQLETVVLCERDGT